MKGTLDYPDMVQLVAMSTPNRTSFYMDNSKMTITGHLDSLFAAVVTGSKTQDEYQAFIDSLKPLTQKSAELTTEYRAAYA